MGDADETGSIEDLINTIKDPVQRSHAMALLNAVLASYNEKMSLRKRVAELEDEIKRLKDAIESQSAAENS